MRIVEAGPLSEEDRERLIAGEHEPFGRAGRDLTWRKGTRSVCVYDEHGQPLAAGGTVVASVDVEGAGTFEVVGLGGVIVTRAARGRGLARTVLERLLAGAAELGPARAMLFCIPRNVPLYVKFGFSEIGAPVRAEQRAGVVEVPMRAMWRPLREGAGWPPGPVRVHGEPF